MRLALEARCSAATVKNWYGRRRLSHGQRWHLEQAAERLGLWTPAPPAPPSEDPLCVVAALQRGAGTPGWVAGSLELPAAQASA